MISKVNVCKIVCDHCRTLVDASTTPARASIGDFILFFVIPAVATFFIVDNGARLDSASIGILLAAFAILTGLLFNLLVLLLSLIEKKEVDPDDELSKIREEKKFVVLNHTFANISYAILLGIALSVFCVAGLYKRINYDWITTGATSIVCFGGLHFALTLLMILKRIHNLLDYKIRD